MNRMGSTIRGILRKEGPRTVAVIAVWMLSLGAWSPSAAADGLGPDWVKLVAQAQESVEDGDVILQVRGRLISGVSAFGWGYADESAPGHAAFYVKKLEINDSTVGILTPGGQRVEATVSLRDQRTPFQFTVSYGGIVGPAGTRVILPVMVAGIEILEVSTPFPDPRFTLSTTTGSGSAFFDVARSDDGVAAWAGENTAGAVSLSANPPTPIVGGIDRNLGFRAYDFNWVDPTGREGGEILVTSPWIGVPGVEYISAGAAMGKGRFAGPAGPWRWTWSGVAAENRYEYKFGTASSPQVLAGFMPMGEDWELFVPPPRLLDEVLARP